MAETRRSADGSQTLERGLEVLLMLADNRSGMTATEVSAALHMHRSIAYRLLVSLQRTGFADRDEVGRYRVGRRLRSVAERSRPQLQDAAEPVLRGLAAELDATASLVEVTGDAVIATVVAEPPTDGPRFSYRLGNRDPVDRGAGGLAALASVAPATGEPERVGQIRAAGYVWTHSEVVPGAYGVAAPIAARGKIAPASVNVVSNRPDVVERAIPLVVEAAKEISRRLDAAVPAAEVRR